MATPQWAASENITYDVGAAVVNPLNRQQLTDVVGGQGIAFNQARGQNMYAFGYPAASPYDGTKLIYRSGRVFNEFLGTGDIGMTCNMTGGASGGPWFLQFAESSGTGLQNSVNSFKYNFSQAWMFGPYFGADARICTTPRKRPDRSGSGRGEHPGRNLRGVIVVAVVETDLS